jgi:hypothetical protein
MLFAMLLATAVPGPAVTAADAERAFAAAAQIDGQWTAFRRYATDDAVMFAPQVVKAQEFLKARKDPSKAIDWWPTESYVSCDGSFAVNTGGWRRPDGAVGYFSTVWVRQSNGNWKWIVDGGDGLAIARLKPAMPAIHTASCSGTPAKPPTIAYREGSSAAATSSDGTIAYRWHVSSNGARQFWAAVWDGGSLTTVIDDKIAAAQ